MHPLCGVIRPRRMNRYPAMRNAADVAFSVALSAGRSVIWITAREK
jgi:hypothetical protein